MHDITTTALEIAHLSKVNQSLRSRAAAAVAAGNRAALNGVIDDAEVIAARAPVLAQQAKAGKMAYRASVALCGQIFRGNTGGANAAQLVLRRASADFARLTKPQTASLGDLTAIKRRRSKNLISAIKNANAALQKAMTPLVGIPLGNLEALGAESFAVTGRDCPVDTSAGDAWTKWDRWCDCMFTGIDSQRCKYKYDLLNRPDPGYLAAPWTDVGAAVRRIPKRDPGLANTAGNLLRVPVVAEYEGDKLYRTLLTDYPRFSVLVGYAVGLASFANPVVGAAVALGTVTSPVAFQAAVVALLPGAIVFALTQPNSEERLQQNIIEPLLALGGDILQTALQAISGNPKLAVVALFARRIAFTLEGYKDPVSKTTAAVIRAIEGSVGDFVEIAENPEGALRSPGMWRKIGDKILLAAKTVPSGDPSVMGVVEITGNVMVLFSDSLGSLVAKDFAGALDNSTVGLFGSKYSILKRMGPELSFALSRENNVPGRLEGLKGGIHKLRQAFDAMLQGMAGWPLFGEAVKLLQWLLREVDKLVEQIWIFVQQLMGAEVQPLPTAVVPLAFRPSYVPPRNTPPPPPPLAKPKAGGLLALTATGAGAGALVGAVPGALIGGAAGLVLALITRKPPEASVPPPPPAPVFRQPTFTPIKPRSLSTPSLVIESSRRGSTLFND